MALFREEIDGWASWGRVFCSIPAFDALARAILIKEGIRFEGRLENLTPGTNAVFRAGDFVVKIFAPEESGLDALRDYTAEVAVMQHARSAGVQVPGLAARGEIADRYLFRYLILEFVAGSGAREALSGMPPAQKRAFVGQIKLILNRLNRPADGLIPRADIVGRAVANERLKGLHPKLTDQLIRCARGQERVPRVLVHGDLTRDNLIVRQDGSVLLIDFADCSLAPYYYEWPPVVLDLFGCDEEMARAFMAGMGEGEFLDLLVKGIALHDFGGGILKELFAQNHVAPNAIDGIDNLKAFLGRIIFKR